MLKDDIIPTDPREVPLRLIQFIYTDANTSMSYGPFDTRAEAFEAAQQETYIDHAVTISSLWSPLSKRATFEAQTPIEQKDEEKPRFWYVLANNDDNERSTWISQHVLKAEAETVYRALSERFPFGSFDCIRNLRGEEYIPDVLKRTEQQIWIDVVKETIAIWQAREDQGLNPTGD